MINPLACIFPCIAGQRMGDRGGCNTASAAGGLCQRPETDQSRATSDPTEHAPPCQSRKTAAPELPECPSSQNPPSSYNNERSKRLTSKQQDFFNKISSILTFSASQHQDSSAIIEMTRTAQCTKSLRDRGACFWRCTELGFVSRFVMLGVCCWSR